VEPLFSITSRTCSGGFENRHGDIGTAAIILAEPPFGGCESIDAALADIGKRRRIEPNPILLNSAKEPL
jgi:hypothetical protein